MKAKTYQGSYLLRILLPFGPQIFVPHNRHRKNPGFGSGAHIRLTNSFRSNPSLSVGVRFSMTELCDWDKFGFVESAWFTRLVAFSLHRRIDP